MTTARQETHPLERAIRLGEFVRRERIARGMTAKEAARYVGLAPGTLLRVEQGQPVRAISLAAVDRLLDLPAGTVSRYLNDPSVDERTLEQSRQQALPLPETDLAGRLAGLDKDDLRRLRDMIDGALAVASGGNRGER